MQDVDSLLKDMRRHMESAHGSPPVHSRKGPRLETGAEIDNRNDLLHPDPHRGGLSFFIPSTGTTLGVGLEHPSVTASMDVARVALPLTTPLVQSSNSMSPSQYDAMISSTQRQMADLEVRTAGSANLASAENNRVAQAADNAKRDAAEAWMQNETLLVKIGQLEDQLAVEMRAQDKGERMSRELGQRVIQAESALQESNVRDGRVASDAVAAARKQYEMEMLQRDRIEDGIQQLVGELKVLLGDRETEIDDLRQQSSVSRQTVDELVGSRLEAENAVAALKIGLKEVSLPSVMLKMKEIEHRDDALRESQVTSLAETLSMHSSVNMPGMFMQGELSGIMQPQLKESLSLVSSMMEVPREVSASATEGHSFADRSTVNSQANQAVSSVIQTVSVLMKALCVKGYENQMVKEQLCSRAVQHQAELAHAIETSDSCKESEIKSMKSKLESVAAAAERRAANGNHTLQNQLAESQARTAALEDELRRLQCQVQDTRLGNHHRENQLAMTHSENVQTLNSQIEELKSNQAKGNSRVKGRGVGNDDAASIRTSLTKMSKSSRRSSKGGLKSADLQAMDSDEQDVPLPSSDELEGSESDEGTASADSESEDEDSTEFFIIDTMCDEDEKEKDTNSEDGQASPLDKFRKAANRVGKGMAIGRKVKLKKAQEEEIKAAFELFDTDGNQTLDADEIRMALSTLGFKPGAEDVQRFMDDIDVDKTGKIDYNEFRLMMMARMNMKGMESEEPEDNGTTRRTKLMRRLSQNRDVSDSKKKDKPSKKKTKASKGKENESQNSKKSDSKKGQKKALSILGKLDDIAEEQDALKGELAQGEIENLRVRVHALESRLHVCSESEVRALEQSRRLQDQVDESWRVVAQLQDELSHRPAMPHCVTISLGGQFTEVQLVDFGEVVHELETAKMVSAEEASVACTQVQHLEVKLASSHAATNTQMEQLAALDDKYTRQLADVMSQKDHLAAELSSASTRLRDHEGSHLSLQHRAEQSEKGYESMALQLETLNAQRHEDSVKIAHEVEDARRKFASEHHERTELAKRMSETEDEKLRLSHELRKALGQIQSAEVDKAALQGEVTGEHEALNMLRTQIRDLQSATERERSQSLSLREDVVTLKSQLAQSEASRDNLFIQKKQLEAAVDCSDSSAAQAVATISNLQNKVSHSEKLSAERDLLAKQVTQLSDELQRLSTAAVKGGSSSAAVGQLQMKLTQAEGDNFRLSETLANVESKMGALNRESQQLVQEMESKVLENAQLKSALSAKDQEVQVVSRQLSTSGLHETEIDRLRRSELDSQSRSDTLARQLEYEQRMAKKQSEELLMMDEINKGRGTEMAHMRSLVSQSQSAFEQRDVRQRQATSASKDVHKQIQALMQTQQQLNKLMHTVNR